MKPKETRMNETMMNAIEQKIILRIASDQLVSAFSDAAIDQGWLVCASCQCHIRDRKTGAAGQLPWLILP